MPEMIKNKFLFCVFVFFIQIGFAQTNFLWQGYFSYNNIGDLAKSTNTLFAASENALFSKNTATNTIKTTNTVDGLSGQTITSLLYSPSVNKTIVGYENGLMIVINESDGSMRNIVDIINKKLPANLKKINHLMDYDGIVYVSCDFGIVQFNLKTLLFGDTYFIGNNGADISVKQTTVFNGFIYAATADGIRKANVSNKNLIDFNQWTTITTGNWSSVEAFDTHLMAINTSGNIHQFNSVSNSFTGFLQLPQASVDMRASDNYLIITTPTTAYVFNKQLAIVRQINTSQITEATVSFSCATSLEDTIYIGTIENGIYSTAISVSSVIENTKPSGPSRNNIFAIQSTTTSLWAVYGDYDYLYNPYSLDSYGISKYSDKGWLNIPYDKVFGAKSLVRLAVNPNNEKEVYVSSFFSGLLKIVNDVPEVLYNQTNSSLETLTFLGPDYIDIRINGLAFDKTGNLWVNNSLINNGLKVLKTNGEWQSFSTEDVVSSGENTHFGRISIDNNGTKWIATSGEGIIGYNEKINRFKKITTGSDFGNLPSDNGRVAAVDNNNALWIGTTLGLRVLPNISSFLTDDKLTSRPIIILEDGLAQELMYEQFITDIVVDGANNKWIGTADSGVFLVSPDGQQTKYHFTSSNSPLPSNVINDIDINSKTGEVFIATIKGMVSFKGTATAAKEDLSNVFVYPNPVRPQYNGTVKISGLLNKAVIKITDIEGNLVYETTSEGGTIEWDTTAFGKYKVASGVYMIFVSAEDGIETKVKKVMIIR